MRHRFDHVALTRLVPRARDIGVHPTRTEGLLWQALRGGRLGVRFRRQVVLHTFISRLLRSQRRPRRRGRRRRSPRTRAQRRRARRAPRVGRIHPIARTCRQAPTTPPDFAESCLRGSLTSRRRGSAGGLPSSDGYVVHVAAAPTSSACVHSAPLAAAPSHGARRLLSLAHPSTRRAGLRTMQH